MRPARSDRLGGRIGSAAEGSSAEPAGRRSSVHERSPAPGTGLVRQPWRCRRNAGAHVSRETTSASPIECTDASVFAQRPRNGWIALRPRLPPPGLASGPGLPPPGLASKDHLSEGRPGTPAGLALGRFGRAWRRRAISIRVVHLLGGLPVGCFRGLVLLGAFVGMSWLMPCSFVDEGGSSQRLTSPAACLFRAPSSLGIAELNPTAPRRTVPCRGECFGSADAFA
jgi:hypothetical protein